MRKTTGIKVVPQKHDYDCGIASMAMFLGLPYGDISAVVRTLYGKTCKQGLAMYQMEEVADQLNFPLKRVYKAKDYLVGKTGILGINGEKIGGHWTVVKDGNTILDPADGKVYKLSDYLNEYKCRSATLLIKM